MAATLSDVRALLHDAVCVGVRGGYCEPGDHDHARRTMSDRAREVLEADDPAAVVHEVVCDADLTAHGCPDRHGHIAVLRERMDAVLRGPVCPHCDSQCMVPDVRKPGLMLSSCAEGQAHDRLRGGYNLADVRAGRRVGR